MTTVSLSITSCMDCPNHQVTSDPDPHDSFCYDDVAVLCKKTPQEPIRGSVWSSDKEFFRPVATSCRPYNKRKESEIPTWCPLRSST